jgi:hypothetical protein
MPRLMKTTGRFVALALAVGLALAACTGDDGGNGSEVRGGDGPSAATGADGGPTPVVSGSATSGTYEYENGGLHVTLDVEGTAGTMEVDNGTGHELEAPGFYILHATDPTVRIDGEVADAAPVEAGASGSFGISFDGIAISDIGAIALLFGADNYGLFVRTA